MRIKAGYRIEVTSWENDADNYKTVALDGLTREDAHLYFDIAIMSIDSSKFSNMYEPPEAESDELDEALERLAQKHGKTGEFVVDDLHDMAGDLGLTSEYYVRRVTEEVTVSYVATEINIPDVTSEFL